jgi:hypothetical protein
MDASIPIATAMALLLIGAAEAERDRMRAASEKALAAWDDDDAPPLALHAAFEELRAALAQEPS